MSKKGSSFPPAAISRITSATAKSHGGQIPAGSFAAKAQSIAAKAATPKQRCRRLAKRLTNGEAVDLLIDSSGLSFGRASQWYEVKYG